MLLIACGIGLTGILSAVSCLPAHLAFTSFSSGQTFSASSARNSNPLGPHRTRKLMFGLSAYDLVASCFCVGTQSRGTRDVGGGTCSFQVLLSATSAELGLHKAQKQKKVWVWARFRRLRAKSYSVITTAKATWS
jgi:hypothetical protein